MSSKKESAFMQLVIGGDVRITEPNASNMLLVEYRDENADWQFAGFVSLSTLQQFLAARKVGD